MYFFLSLLEAPGGKEKKKYTSRMLTVIYIYFLTALQMLTYAVI